ncbi:deoxyguanosinetriphosphate triphosphohydrolase family protein [Chitinophaga sancti]|uniref:Deoxyguanosinetriphosphate triphosphohydrolase-like protein n=1 Tax=Chitinophaga sancti TaxID=1004 RepID=A0A1K1SLQ0_9BACT|nr:dNTP triphosphohydrolase [Chitinophaga sancti]WQD65432.1 dNTP triphosphohydrolase [Chitinophaga sancti]WQG88945.1 dNTP triphosphohydrolase [Chitinophaga sancti]SFW85015.1 dGTPase [Chitinophaga sancti]
MTEQTTDPRPFLYTDKDKSRNYLENLSKACDYRSPYRRDIDRLIHATCFRRLQGKTQLYPGFESDFFRNRLTHSIEVASIARAIATKLNDQDKFLEGRPIDLDIVEFAGLAHDLGHPPFGHQGEYELDSLMREHGGYEGNAQTLRLLSKIEKKGFSDGDSYNGIEGQDERHGLNITYRGLASILKYDLLTPEQRPRTEFWESGEQKGKKIKPVKGYYWFDEDLVQKIKTATGGNEPGKRYKSLECQIMDVADDISYSTYDLEDGLKAGFYTLQDVVFPKKKILQAISDEIELELPDGKIFKPSPEKVGEILQNMFTEFLFQNFQETQIRSIDDAFKYLNSQYSIISDYSHNGYQRNFLTSTLVNRFIEGVKLIPEEKFPTQSKVILTDNILGEVEVLKKFTYISQVLSSRLKIAEFRGREIVKEIFETLDKPGGCELLPDDFRNMYESPSADKKRIICDFVAGMTDRYAIEFYARLKSENAETIFKPL